MHPTIQELKTYGNSRAEISRRLNSLGFQIDQSTIHKWENMESPSTEVIQRAERALALLRLQPAGALEDARRLAHTLTQLQGLHLNGNNVGNYDLMPVLKALQVGGIDEFTLKDFAAILALSIVRGEILVPDMATALIKAVRSTE